MLSEAEKQKIVKEKAKAKAKALKEKEKAKAMKEKEKAKAKKDKEKAKAKAKKDKEKAKAKAKKARVKGGNLEDRLALPDDLILPIGDEETRRDVDKARRDVEDLRRTALFALPENVPRPINDEVLVIVDVYIDDAEMETKFLDQAITVAKFALHEGNTGCSLYNIYKITGMHYKLFQMYNKPATSTMIFSKHLIQDAFTSSATETTEDDYLTEYSQYTNQPTTFKGEQIYPRLVRHNANRGNHLLGGLYRKRK